MAKKYRPVDRDQPFLLPPDIREWLPPGHPVHLVITAVEDHLDTSAFHARRRTGGAGTAGYDPDMLATVLVWAYAHGITSSRRIEELCRTDVAFRLICAGNLPDHSTFARFRSDFPDATAAFFTEVLILCARLGMGRLGMVALDGMKIAADASKAANRTEDGLRKLAQAGRPLRDPPRQPASEHCRVKEAAAQVDKARAREQAAEQRAAERDKSRKGPGPVRNITDPDSRLMPVHGGGFGQCCNTENVVSGDKLIIATELTDDPTDMGWFEPMMAQAEGAAALIDAHRPASPAPGPDPASPAPGPDGGIGLALSDSGYCSEANLTGPGPDRLIAVGKRRDLEKAARGQDTGPDWGGEAVQAMRDRLKTEDGMEAYRQRGHIAETPHGHIKHNMGLRQLSVRGKPEASAEWMFICAVHNLFKALTAGHLTGQALAALAS
jgi:transposase